MVILYSLSISKNHSYRAAFKQTRAIGCTKMGNADVLPSVGPRHQTCVVIFPSKSREVMVTESDRQDRLIE